MDPVLNWETMQDSQAATTEVVLAARARPGPRFIRDVHLTTIVSILAKR